MNELRYFTVDNIERKTGRLLHSNIVSLFHYIDAFPHLCYDNRKRRGDGEPLAPIRQALQFDSVLRY